MVVRLISWICLIANIVLFGCGSVEEQSSSEIVLTAVADAYVSSDQTSTNFGRDKALYVSSTEKNQIFHKTFIRFDLSMIPKKATIDTAILDLTLNTTSNTSLEEVVAYRVMEKWEEDKISFKSAPPYDTSTSADSCGVAPNLGTYQCNITELVSEWHTGIYSNFGLALVSTSSHQARYQRYFLSREAEQGVPRLRVYFRCLNHPPVLDLVPQVSVTEGCLLSFRVDAIDPDGDNVSYDASVLPPGASFRDRIFHWQPKVGQAGKYSAQFTATDNGQPQQKSSHKMTMVVLPLIDSDNDGTPDDKDNCPKHTNPDQYDTDGDGYGDVCDDDADADNVKNGRDNCPLTQNPVQNDSDRDGFGDACDSCRDIPNPNQADSDTLSHVLFGQFQSPVKGEFPDLVGDACDNCPNVYNPNQKDQDADFLGDACDNCPYRFNHKQEDADKDGVGDACDPVPTKDAIDTSFLVGPKVHPITVLCLQHKEGRYTCYTPATSAIRSPDGAWPNRHVLIRNLKNGEERSLVASQFDINEGSGFGVTVVSLEDINGDRVEDLAIGVPLASRSDCPECGAVLIVSGQTGELLLRLDGKRPGSSFGHAVARVKSEAVITVGAPGLTDGNDPGHVYLFNSKGTQILDLKGESPGDRFGASVAATIHQGKPLILIGSPGADPVNGINAGTVYVFETNGSLAERFDGKSRTTTETFGLSLAVAGDGDGDGIGVILIGSPLESVGNLVGAGRVYRFTLNGLKLDTLSGRSAGDQFGWTVAGGKDIDADGRPDFLVGAPGVDGAGMVDPGSAYLFSGQGYLMSRFDGTMSGERLGTNVAIGCTRNSDGGLDVVVGAVGSNTKKLPHAWGLHQFRTELLRDDKVPNNIDNCHGVFNPDQTDTDGDGIGDACDPVLDMTQFVYLSAGSNLFSYPVSVPPAYDSFALHLDLGGHSIRSIRYHDPNTGQWRETRWDAQASSPTGDKFAIQNGQAYIVEAEEAVQLTIKGVAPTGPVNLRAGVNYAAFPLAPPYYNSYLFLKDLGVRRVERVQRLNRTSGLWETAAIRDSLVTGKRFPIRGDEGVLVFMREETDWTPTMLTRLELPESSFFVPLDDYDEPLSMFFRDDLLGIEPDNPESSDVLIHDVTLMAVDGVDVETRRVTRGTSFELAVLVRINTEHSGGVVDFGIDRIGVRLLASHTDPPDDPGGLATTMERHAGCQDRVLVRGAGLNLNDDLPDMDRGIVIEMSAATIIPHPEASTGETFEELEATTEARRFFENPNINWLIYHFVIDSTDLYPGPWSYTVEVDWQEWITEYYEHNNQTRPDLIQIVDQPRIEIFEVAGTSDPTVARICPGHNVSVHYRVRSGFPFTGRVEYGDHHRDLERSAEGIVTTGALTESGHVNSIDLVIESPGGSDRRTIPVEYIPSRFCGTGINFSAIPWAQTVTESQDRLEARRRAVAEFWDGIDMYPWEMNRLLKKDEWNDATRSIDVCIAKLWRAFNDPNVQVAPGRRNFLIREVNEYLTSSGNYAFWPELQPNRIGTLNEFLTQLGWGGDDYDFRLRKLTALAYLFKDEEGILSEENKAMLLGEMLNVMGSDHHLVVATEREIEEEVIRALRGITPLTAEMSQALAITAGMITGFLGGLGDLAIHGLVDRLAEGAIEETENHILMSETSRYLKNQLIASGRYRAYITEDPDDPEYNNESNGFNDWMKRHLAQFLRSGFNEYNSLTYSGLSMAALANLYDFTEDPEVKKSSRIVLDYISARFATQSFDLKRCVGFCRKPENIKKTELWSDPMAAWFAVLIGNYAGLQEDYGGIWRFHKSDMLPAATTSYRVPSLILDLAIDKSHNPYEIRVYHKTHTQNIEILSAQRGYLLSAGGWFSEHNYWWNSFLGKTENKKHHGWARPTALIVRSGQRIIEPLDDPDDPCNPDRLDSDDPGDYLIYSWGNHMKKDTLRNNTGVWHNIAVCDYLRDVSREWREFRYPFSIPCRWLPRVVMGSNDWKFLHLEESGLFVAVNDSSPILEVADDDEHGGQNFHAFRETVQAQHPEGPQGSYVTSQGHRITFDVSAPPGRLPIKSINGVNQETEYHRWPLISSFTWPFISSLTEMGKQRVMWADGNGLVIVNNPYMRQSLILSLTDWQNPIRIEQGCAAEDLVEVPGTTFDASVNAASAGQAFDNNRQTSWVCLGNPDAWLRVDFEEERTFNFISLRTQPEDVRRINSITIETTTDGSAYRPIFTKHVNHTAQFGIDIELGSHIARGVQFRFNGPRADIQEIEIYRYAEPVDVVPDPYEDNDTWYEATRVTPGVRHSPTIHQVGDEDYYEIELLAGNRVRATVDYDTTILRGNLTVQIWGWSVGNAGAPVQLVSNTSQEISGNRVMRHAEWEGAGEKKTCLVRVVSDNDVTGSYTLIIQTRGPELTRDAYESMDQPVRIEREMGSEMTVLDNLNIHTGGYWTDWVIPHGDRDYFVVSVPGRRRLIITMVAENPDVGKPYAIFHEPDDVQFDDNRSEWPSRQVLTVRPENPCSDQSQDVHFSIRAEHCDTYCNNTGGYRLEIEIPVSGNGNVFDGRNTIFGRDLDDMCSITRYLTDDLGQHYDPSDIDVLMEQGVEYEFDIPDLSNPYVLKVVSRATGQIIHEYEFERDRFISDDAFAATVMYFNELPR